MKTGVVLIGFSGHGYVAYDIFRSMGQEVLGYCDNVVKTPNQFGLEYMGHEEDELVLSKLKRVRCFVAIGNNHLRGKISAFLQQNDCQLANAIHPSAVISVVSTIGKGVMVGPNVVINALAHIEDGVICNSACIIEHECIVGKYSHIAPGAVLCGNVSVGTNTLVGAGAVIRPNIRIGHHVTIGAGCVVVKDIPDNTVVVGNPQKSL